MSSYRSLPRGILPVQMFLLCALLGSVNLFGCGDDNSHALLAWSASTEAIPVGGVLEEQALGPAGPWQMRALGFTPVHDRRWQRQAAVNASLTAKPLGADALPHVGAISVLSIDRNNGQTPYLYATLRSLFDELPADAVVNVFVGDASLDYVQPDRLAEHVGLDAALRVHVVGSDQGVLDYMQVADFTRSERASWNYARMLRAYRGPLWHLTFEDDVELGRGSLRAFEALVGGRQPDVLSLYNNKCWGEDTPLEFAKPRIKRHGRSSFWGTQSVAFFGAASYDVGTYVQAHLGELPFDLLINRYLKRGAYSLGYVYPSMVQHMGVLTSGLGFHHTSDCYMALYPSVR